VTAGEVKGIAPLMEKAASALDAGCKALAADRPPKLLLALSLAIAAAFCLHEFDAGFLLGTSPYWSNPRGLVGLGWYDLSTALSGYFYFQHDTWQWPLFHVDKLGAPAGMNIIFTDSIPWVVLAGRLMFRLTGQSVNLYGLWTAFCFVASATTLTALVAALGQRSLAAAAMATTAGLCMPALLARWGHMSMMGQFEIPLTLIFYLRNHRCNRPWPLFIKAASLMWLALWTHSYLFAMACAIVFATIGQAFSNSTLNGKTAISVSAGLAAIMGAVMALSGYLQSRGGLGAGGVGIFSMNLLSPFFPQRSGLIASLRNVMADGTGGQYEGFSYLGAGLLVLLIMTLPQQARVLRSGIPRHPWMSTLLLGFTIFALSNAVYLGPIQLLHIPLPGPIMQLAAMFRSTGRFFWPVMYSLAALAIAAPVPMYGCRGALLLCLAVPLQWIDTAPLRQALAAITRTPEAPHIHLAAWQAAIRQHESVRVLPQNFCLRRQIGWNNEVAVQLQLLAALADRPINTVYASRYTADCAAERQIDATSQAGARQLSVYLDEYPGYLRMRQLAATSNACRAGAGVVVCSDIAGQAAALTALAQTDRK
jgi:hypothetical protein